MKTVAQFRKFASGLPKKLKPLVYTGPMRKQKLKDIPKSDPLSGKYIYKSDKIDLVKKALGTYEVQLTDEDIDNLLSEECFDYLINITYQEIRDGLMTKVNLEDLREALEDKELKKICNTPSFSKLMARVKEYSKSDFHYEAQNLYRELHILHDIHIKAKQNIKLVASVRPFDFMRMSSGKITSCLSPDKGNHIYRSGFSRECNTFILYAENVAEKNKYKAIERRVVCRIMYALGECSISEALARAKKNIKPTPILVYDRIYSVYGDDDSFIIKGLEMIANNLKLDLYSIDDVPSYSVSPIHYIQGKKYNETALGYSDVLEMSSINLDRVEVNDDTCWRCQNCSCNQVRNTNTYYFIIR